MVSELTSEPRAAQKGRRRTPQRLLVARSLASSKRALSAQELHGRIRADHPRLGLATVYRALETLVQDGLARRFEREGHVSAYVACDAEHHHHLVCLRCQRVEDIGEQVVRPMLSSVRRRHDFQVDHAALDLYGECASCRKRARERRPAGGRRGGAA